MHELEVAIRLAREAGALALSAFGTDIDIESKAGGEPVSEADRAADAMIRHGLLDAFPDDGLLTEESPDDLERLTKRRVWIVDPIDGTKHFLRGIPEFAVMIGLAVEGRAVVGVIHLPAEGETLAAEDGAGCRRIDRDGESSDVRLHGEVASLREAAIVVSRSASGSRTSIALERLAPRAVMHSGSVGRKAVLVATGRADAYFTLGGRSRHWDACAAEVIVREAGGTFTDADGQPIVYNTKAIRNERGLLACRRELFSPLTSALAHARDA